MKLILINYCLNDNLIWIFFRLFKIYDLFFIMNHSFYKHHNLFLYQKLIYYYKTRCSPKYKYNIKQNYTLFQIRVMKALRSLHMNSNIFAWRHLLLSIDSPLPCVYLVITELSQQSTCINSSALLWPPEHDAYRKL